MNPGRTLGEDDGMLDWLNNIGHLLGDAFVVGVMLLVIGGLLWRRRRKTVAMQLLTALLVTIGLAILLLFACTGSRTCTLPGRTRIRQWPRRLKRLDLQRA
jgi:LPXTG-motif cell wall-anchored protein